MVYRVYAEKRKEYAGEARELLEEINSYLGIKSLTGLRVVNRYDCEGIDEKTFISAVKTVFSEPQTDDFFFDIPDDVLSSADTRIFAVEYLPGQFDQRADSAAQCIQIMSCGERPLVRTARVYILSGKVGEDDLSEIKKYVINPVESREASLEPFATLEIPYSVPERVKTVEGFTRMSDAEIKDLAASLGLAMDADDLAFCRDYFAKEGRDPTISEIRIVDTYWSDHCRHTTFLTSVDSVKMADGQVLDAYRRYLETREALEIKKPVCLMDMATIAAKYLKKKGVLRNLDESDEINACTVRINVERDGTTEPWLLLFKNETHNHPTEIEPFGGAATCIGGAIRDPLSGRSYVYAAMRVTGASDPTAPVSGTVEGKLPQRKIVRTAAAGYSSYGNQIGLATGIVSEVYHPGYVAKHMEIGAVLGAAPAGNVRREKPCAGDVVILLGGRTGRDGIGGATGSSKAHNLHSVETCGAEVQKGNAPEERKLQRFFRDPAVCGMIKKCNDFGAGGVSVAIGELADGLEIDLNAVTRKYEGLDGTELAISESQERMAVVVGSEDRERFIALADGENLEATAVARVTGEPRLVMKWNGQTVCDISRAFLDSNGVEKHIDVEIPAYGPFGKQFADGFAGAYRKTLADLNCCSQRGLSERFDSTIGSGTVLMPFGGKYQRTPVQAMVHRIPLEHGRTETCSVMSWGYNPVISGKNPFCGAYLAVFESVSKLVAAGASLDGTYLTFQEYFAKPGNDGKRWGAPVSALLGAFRAQTELGIGAIGGKDSMSGTFENIDVPPTLVSFAVTTEKAGNIISGEFKGAGHDVVIVEPEYDACGLPVAESFLDCCRRVAGYVRSGGVYAAYTPAGGGIAEAVYKMCIGNGIGFAYEDGTDTDRIFGYRYGSFILETDGRIKEKLLGRTIPEPVIRGEGGTLTLAELDGIYEGRLEEIYPVGAKTPSGKPPKPEYGQRSVRSPAVRTARPRVLIPVFPGTNCEYDSVRAVEDAGAEGRVFVINNRTPAGVAESAETFARLLGESQILFIPGGFSGGDEPDGSGKFITAFLRNARVREKISELLDGRDGLVCGICNGFQALIKVGLVPFGKITDTDSSFPTLTFNDISRHQSKLVRVRVASVKSPWLSGTRVGEIFTVPVSHGEGKFVCSGDLLEKLAENGQIATQYVDLSGQPTYDIQYNPNGSVWAVEGITSPDGRVFGKMGHTERCADGLYKNVPGNYDMGMFASAVKYFS